jgi:hypothetical protein
MTLTRFSFATRKDIKLIIQPKRVLPIIRYIGMCLPAGYMDLFGVKLRNTFHLVNSQARLFTSASPSFGLKWGTFYGFLLKLVRCFKMLRAFDQLISDLTVQYVNTGNSIQINRSCFIT